MGTLALACDRPLGHLPIDDHAVTIHWKALHVTVTVAA
jgi:hypothetical protein